MNVSAVLAMWWRDLRALLRDRSAIVIGVLAPAGLIAVFSLASSGPAVTARPVGFVGDGEPLAMTLEHGALAAMVDDGTIELTGYDDDAALRTAIEDGDVWAGLVASGSRIEVVSGPDSSITSMILRSVAGSTATVADEVARVTGARVAAGAAPGDPAATASALTQPIVRLDDSIQRVGGLSERTLVAIGMASFFLFFTVQFGVIGLLTDQRTGTLRRLLAAPLRPWEVLVAKLGVSFVLGVVSMTVLIAFSAVLLDAGWGDPIGVGLLVLTGVAAAVSTVTLVVGLARNSEQASQAQSALALVLGIVGGSFFSMARSGPIGATVTKLTPHHWFAEGIIRTSDGDGWTAALVPALWLVVFALVIGVPGALLAHRTVRP